MTAIGLGMDSPGASRDPSRLQRTSEPHRRLRTAKRPRRYARPALAAPTATLVYRNVPSIIGRTRGELAAGCGALCLGTDRTAKPSAIRADRAEAPTLVPISEPGWCSRVAGAGSHTTSSACTPADATTSAAARTEERNPALAIIPLVGKRAPATMAPVVRAAGCFLIPIAVTSTRVGSRVAADMPLHPVANVWRERERGRLNAR